MVSKPFFYRRKVYRDREATDDSDFWLWQSHYWIIVKGWQSRANIHRRGWKKKEERVGEIGWEQTERESCRGGVRREEDASPVTNCSLVESINPSICVTHTVPPPPHQRSSVHPRTPAHTRARVINAHTPAQTDATHLMSSTPLSPICLRLFLRPSPLRHA